MRFVGNLILNTRRIFADDVIIVASSDVIIVASSVHRTQRVCVLFSPSFLS